MLVLSTLALGIFFCGRQLELVADTTNLQQEFSLFLTNYTELQQLIVHHQTNPKKLDQTTNLLWKILQSPKYLHHKPNTGILFIKTHKTGSSTISSILHSLATSHVGITTPVVKRPEWKATRPELYTQPTNQISTQNAPYDVWCNHILYNAVNSDSFFDNIMYFFEKRMVSICLKHLFITIRK